MLWHTSTTDCHCCCPPLVQDILLQGEGGAQVLVDPELVEHFESCLTRVRSVPVQVSRVPLDALRVAPPRTQRLSSVEASTRLDAIASAGASVTSCCIVLSPLCIAVLAGVPGDATNRPNTGSSIYPATITTTTLFEQPTVFVGARSCRLQDAKSAHGRDDQGR